MKAVILTGVLAVTVLASIACGSDPTATPQPTPTPTRTPTALENVQAIIEGALETIQEGRMGELTITVIEVICDVDAGAYSPGLSIEDVADNRLVRLAIRGFCNSRGDSGA